MYAVKHSRRKADTLDNEALDSGCPSPFLKVLDEEILPAELSVISEVVDPLPVEEVLGVERVICNIPRSARGSGMDIQSISAPLILLVVSRGAHLFSTTQLYRRHCLPIFYFLLQRLQQQRI